MWAIRVLTIFSTAILFNVICPSGDVYSDLALMVNTLGFHLGESTLLSGCRVCYGKDDHDVYDDINRTCQPCLTSKNDDFHLCFEFPRLVDIYNEMQKSKACTEEKWRIHPKIGTDTHSLTKGECLPTDDCCLKNTNETIINSAFSNTDRKVLVYALKNDDDYMLNPSLFDSVHGRLNLLIGRSDYVSCAEMYQNVDMAQAELLINPLINTNVPFKGNNLNELFFKMEKSNTTRVRLSLGFNFHDQCGIYVQPFEPIRSNGVKTCGDDSCFLHLRILHMFSKIHDLKSWKSETDFMHGKLKVGGKTCKLLRMNGWTLLIPILINSFFNIVIFFNDVKNEKATAYEVIPLLFLFYPQWKTLKILWNYVFKHRNQAKLDMDINEVDRDVGSLEPFLEAPFQVGMYRHI